MVTSGHLPIVGTMSSRAPGDQIKLALGKTLPDSQWDAIDVAIEHVLGHREAPDDVERTRLGEQEWVLVRHGERLTLLKYVEDEWLETRYLGSLEGCRYTELYRHGSDGYRTSRTMNVMYPVSLVMRVEHPCLNGETLEISANHEQAIEDLGGLRRVLEVWSTSRPTSV